MSRHVPHNNTNCVIFLLHRIVPQASSSQRWNLENLYLEYLWSTYNPGPVSVSTDMGRKNLGGGES